MKKTSYHLQCECDFMATMRESVMGKLFPDPKDIRNMDVKDVLKTVKQTKIFQHIQTNHTLKKLRCKGVCGPTKGPSCNN